MGSKKKWISFEPTVEFKFSNLHAANQVVNGRLVCTVAEREDVPHIVPINRELLDGGGIHFNRFLYCYDYLKSLKTMWSIGVDYDVPEVCAYGNVEQDSEPYVYYQLIGPTICMASIEAMKKKELPIWDYEIDDSQKYYDIRPLCLHENTKIQSPVDVNGFVKHRIGEVMRSEKQVRTFTSIVKKYRPVIMPNVRDIFNDCVNDSTKYEVDMNNDYGVFGWCTIPSKTMVNMEYNEQAIIVPSSYDHHNRVGGSNFL
jgi:hypothetical protein